MASLANQAVSAAYEQLLHVDRDGGGDTTTLVSVKDGDNETTFCLQLATTSALINGSGSKLYFSDAGGEYISGDGTDLTITSGADIILAGTAVNITADTIDLSDATKDVTLNAAVDALNFDSNTLSIDASNNRVGIGTANPAYTIQVLKSINDYVHQFTNSHATDPYGGFTEFTGAAPDNNTNVFWRGADTVGNKVIIYSDGDLQNHDNSYGAISDERIKQDIRDANSQWDDIKALKVRNFKRKDDIAQYGDDAWEQIGVVAQEVEEAGMDKLVNNSPPSDFELEHCGFGDYVDAVLYEAGDDELREAVEAVEGVEGIEAISIGDVKEEAKWTVKQDEDGEDMQVKSMKYSILYMKAVKALQEAMGRIEGLETKVEALESA